MYFKEGIHTQKQNGSETHTEVLGTNV